MKVQTFKQQITEKNWLEIFNRRSQSGLKINDFCSQEGISRDAYYYWLRKLRENAIESIQPDKKECVRFVKLEQPLEQKNSLTCIDKSFDTDVVGKAACFVPQLTIQVGKANIAVNEYTPKGLILSVMEVILHAE